MRLCFQLWQQYLQIRHGAGIAARNGSSMYETAISKLQMGLAGRHRHNKFSWTILCKGGRWNEVNPTGSTNQWDKVRQQHRNFVSYSFREPCGFFLTSPVNHVEQKLQETGGLVNSSLQLRLNSAIWSSQAIKGTKKKSSRSRCLTVNDWKKGELEISDIEVLERIISGKQVKLHQSRKTLLSDKEKFS